MKSNRDTAQLLVFVRIILIELSTRTMNKEDDKENINFTELLNDSFITAESLRNELKKFVGQLDSDLIYRKRNANVIQCMIFFIEKLMTFQNKWNASYTNWLSSFKAQKTNRHSLVSGEEYLHLNYQTLYPNFKRIHWETENLMIAARSLIGEFEGYKLYLENELDWQAKSFIHKLFNSKPKVGLQP